MKHMNKYVKNHKLFNIRLEVIKHKCQTTLVENLFDTYSPNIYHYIFST